MSEEEIGQQDDKSIEQVEADIAKKEEERLNALKEEMRTSFETKLEEINTQNKETIEGLKKELDTSKELIDRYNKRFEDVNKEIQELKPRKGMVNEDGNPFPEISDEGNIEAQQQQQQQQLTPKEQLERLKSLNPQEDRMMAQSFIDSIRK